MTLEHPRMAILLSGHIRSACSEGKWAIQQQVTRCRSVFTRCDVFMHTWEASDVEQVHVETRAVHSFSSALSWGCVRELSTIVAPLAVTVQRQAVDVLNMSRNWGSSSISYEGAVRLVLLQWARNIPRSTSMVLL